MDNKKIEELKKGAISFEIDHKDMDKWEEEKNKTIKEQEEQKEKCKLEYLKGIYENIMSSNEEIDTAEEENKRLEKLVVLNKNGELSLDKYIKQFDKDDVCYSLSTLLFDCEGDTYSNYLLEVLKENIDIDYYIEILENKYLGHHDT